MDRNTVIGLLLIFLLFLGFSFYQTSRNQKIAEEQRAKNTEQTAGGQKDTLSLKVDSEIPEERKIDEPVAQSAFYCPSVIDTGDYIVETARAIYAFSKKGGYLRHVLLKDVYRYTPKDSAKKILKMFGDNSNILSITLMMRDQTEVSTGDCYFISDRVSDTLVTDAENNTLVLRLYPYRHNDSLTAAAALVPDRTAYVEYRYTFKPDDYRFGYKVRFVNMASYLYPNKHGYTLEWRANPRTVEKNYENEKNITSIYYMDNEKKVGNLNERKDDEKNFTTPLQWVSFKQQFFTTCLIADSERFESGALSVGFPAKTETSVLKHCAADLEFSMPDLNKSDFNMSFYVGPNQYKLLKTYKLKLERQVPLGWGFFLLHWVNRFAIIPVFNWLEAYGLNYGIIILILTIMLKILLLPISYKTYMSSAKMRVLKPELDIINRRYPKDDDMMKKQQATMMLYRRAGVKPAGGCLPMLLQMPILIAMYRFFPAAYELRQKSFLWAEDLSTYDSIWDFGLRIPLYGDHMSLFTILMTIATIVYTWLNNKLMNPSAGSRDQQRMMNIMMYMMPVMFLFMFNNFSSALTYYYLLFNLLTFLQMWIFRMSINDARILNELRLNMQKPIKKSRWQLKMEALQKQQAQMLKEKSKHK